MSNTQKTVKDRAFYARIGATSCKVKKSRPVEDGLVTYIELSGKNANGARSLVNLDDLATYWGKPWHLSDTGYAVRRSRGKTKRLHRLIAKTPKHLVTDHINRDKLDNRRSNLRACTQRENILNSEFVDNARGIWFHKQIGLWAVEVREVNYGLFRTEAEALAYAKRAQAGEDLPVHKVGVRPDADTHCVNGHEYAVVGRYVYPYKSSCKKCQSDKSRKYYKAKKSKEKNNGF